MESEQEVEYPVWNWKWPDEGIGVDGFYEEDDEEEEMLAGDGLNMEHHWSPSFPFDLDSNLAKTVDCDCPGLPPPPRFALPPPPVPSSACNSDNNGIRNTNYNTNVLSDLEYCDVQVMEGPYTQTAIPSIAVIVVCSFIILVMILIAFLIFWRHKRKMQNFLPCKTSPTNHCDLNTGGSTVLYEDLTNIRPRNITNHCSLNQTVAPMELLDVKCSNYGGAGFTPVGDTAFMYSTTPASTDFVVSNVAVASAASSEGELAGDELSLGDYPCQRAEEYITKSQPPEVNGGSRHCSDTSSLRGSTGDDLCRDFDDSLCSDETGGEHGRKNQSHRVHPQSHNGSLFGGPTLISTDQRKRRRGKVRNVGVDLIRVPSVSGKPVDVLCQVPQYHTVNLGRQPIDVNGVCYAPDDGYGDKLSAAMVNHSPWLPRSCSSGGGCSSWRGTPETRHRGTMHHDDYEIVDDRGGEMVLVIPPPPFNTTGHMQRSNSSHHNQQPLMTELNVPKLSLPYHRPPARVNNVNNTVYREGNGGSRRIPPLSGDEDYCEVVRRGGGGSGANSWEGPESMIGVQRKSDPHERTIGEFSTFRPRKNPRDNYCLNAPAYVLNGSKGSNTSVERLIAADSVNYHHPYQQPHIGNLSNQHFFTDLDPSRRTLPNQMKNKKKTVNDMADSAGTNRAAAGRTVLT
ncbi:hypothetical protein CHUAL_003746 [Chamberlinius hualienensis]